MSNTAAQIGSVVGRMTDLDTQIQDILMRNYGLLNDKADPGFLAYGMMAMEVANALSNVFLAIKHPEQHRTFRALCDLTYQLNTNDFWQKNAAVLMPAIHVALNAYRDGAVLAAERAERKEYGSNDSLIAASRAAPLELFPLIAYLIGGPALMVSASIPLKVELAPYFL